MALPSPHLVRDVVASFLSKTESWPKVAEQSVNKVDDESAEEPSGEPSTKGSLYAQYTDLVRRVLDHLIFSTIDVAPDSPEAGPWGQADVDETIDSLSEKLPKMVEYQMARNLSTKLNRAVGTYDYYLKRRDTEEVSPKWSPKAVRVTTFSKPVAQFQGPKMEPANVYSRFATMLSEESGKEITAKSVREDYKYEAVVHPFYDENDFRTKAEVKEQSTIDAMVTMLTEYGKDPNKFLRLMAKQVAPKNPAVSWMKPPRGKTQSGIEEGGREKREMDPVVGDLLFGAMRRREPVEWQYNKVRVENDSEGNHFQMLDLVFPKIGSKVYSVRVPDDVGGALRDARDGEKFYIDVLDYDPSKGFKVKFPDQAERIYKSAEKIVREHGVSAQQLLSTVQSMVNSYVKSVINPMKIDDLPNVVQEHLGKIVVDGRDVTNTTDLADLKDAHEKRREVAGPSGRPGQEGVDRSVLKEFRQSKREQAERDRLLEDPGIGHGKDISEVVRSTDPVNKASDKISDVISRRFPQKAPFTDSTSTWTILKALYSRDAMRWLVGLALDEALPVTTTGKVPWESLVSELFKSDVLGDPEDSAELFDNKALTGVLQSLKMALLAQKPGLTDEDKKKALADYQAGRLQVSPEDRKEISKMLSSKGDEAIKKDVQKLRAEIMKAFMQLYTDRDPDIVRVVEMSESKLKENEEGTQGRDQPVPTFKSRMEQVRSEEMSRREKTDQAARKFEEMLLNRDFVNAEKALQSVAAPKSVMEALKTFEGMPQTNPESPRHEQTLRMVEDLSDKFEEALSEPAGERMLEKYKAVTRGDEPGATKPDVPKKKRGRPPKAQVQAPAPEPTPKQAGLYRWVVKLAMSHIIA